MQFPGALQTSFPYSPPPQGMGAPYTFSQQTRALMNFRPDWATKLIETVNAMSKELGKLNTIEKKNKKTLSGIQTSVQNLESKVEVMDGQFKNCEKSCDFLSKEYDDQKT